MINKNRSIAIIGNSKITKFLIDYLHSHNVKIKYLITLKNKNKFEIIDPYEFKNEKLKIIYVNSYSLEEKEVSTKLRKLKIDFLLVFGWSRLIPKWLLDIVKISTIGVHAGMFNPPRCRGRAVFNWSMILNFKKLIVYAMELKPGIDDGDIFIKEKILISDQDDINSLYLKNAILSSSFFLKIIKNWNYFSKIKKKQNNKNSSYLPKRNPSDSFINWHLNSRDIYNFVRALKNPYPNAFTIYKNQIFYILEAIEFDFEYGKYTEPGQIVYKFGNNQFVIKCKKGFVLARFKVSKHLNKINVNSILTSNKKKIKLNY